MSGILNNKDRILDTFITSEGRRQIGTGKLKIEWASFSDEGTVYEFDSISGSSDISNRLYLEASSLPQDSLTFESDDSGKLLPFPTSNELGIFGGKLLSGSISGSYYDIINDQGKFSSLSGKLLNSSIDNFVNLRLIGSINSTFDDGDFLLSSNNVEFIITNKNPISSDKHTAELNFLEKFNEDKRLSHIPNFAYLPPINKVSGELSDEIIKQNMLGNYTRVSWQAPLKTNDVLREISNLDKSGFVKTINFDAKTFENNIIIQFFEKSNSEILKLDIIEFKDKIWFIGKILVNDLGQNSFVHLFTIKME